MEVLGPLREIFTYPFAGRCAVSGNKMLYMYLVCSFLLEHLKNKCLKINNKEQ